MTRIDNAIRFTIGECSLGRILVAISDKGVCAISFGDEPETLARELRDQCLDADPVADDAGLKPVLAEVVALVENPARGLDLPLDIQGRAFQPRVWQALRRQAPGRAMARSPSASANRTKRMRSAKRAPRTGSRWPFLAIGSCARTARSPAIAGATGASALFSPVRHGHKLAGADAPPTKLWRNLA